MKRIEPKPAPGLEQMTVRQFQNLTRDLAIEMLEQSAREQQEPAEQPAPRPITKRCKDCSGYGIHFDILNQRPVPCPTCNGTGVQVMLPPAEPAPKRHVKPLTYPVACCVGCGAYYWAGEALTDWQLRDNQLLHACHGGTRLSPSRPVDLWR